MRFATHLVVAVVLAATAGAASGCSSTDPTAVDASLTVKGYAALVRASYADALSSAVTLQTAVNALVAAPSEATLTAAKDAWKTAKPIYSQTEAFRFYGGPIDAEPGGPEGEINAWPIDENFIDYTERLPTAGIINNLASFPEINQSIIGTANASGGEKNVSAGWHAIEFLLWGQDLSPTGPGARPYTDYVAGAAATNTDRRGTYLKAATDLLVKDLTYVKAQWDDTADSYAGKMVAGDTNDAISKILLGLGSLAAGELARQRMNDAYTTKDQEEEHDCFSDTTTTDLYTNLLGVQNVYLGTYGSVTGQGVDKLVAAKDASLDAKMKSLLTTALASIKAIPLPFDQAILGDDTAPGRVAIKKAIDDTKAVGDTFVPIAKVLGVKLNIEE